MSAQSAVDKLRGIIGSIGQLVPFGSRVNGTAHAGADMDLAILPFDQYCDELDQCGIDATISRICDKLRRNRLQILYVWDTATAPVVAVEVDGFRVELVLNGAHGVVGSWLIRDVFRGHPKAVKVVKAVKAWANENDLIGGSAGRLTSHGLTVFAIHYLQTIGVLGLPHLDKPQWSSSELYEMARGGPDHYWWVPNPKRGAKSVPSLKRMVRGCPMRLEEDLTASNPSVHSMTTRALYALPRKDRSLIYIQDPLTRINIAKNLRGGPRGKLLAKLDDALAFLFQNDSCTSELISPRGA